MSKDSGMLGTRRIIRSENQCDNMELECPQRGSDLNLVTSNNTLLIPFTGGQKFLTTISKCRQAGHQTIGALHSTTYHNVTLLEIMTEAGE
jgi:hypothetical protein